MKETSLAHNGQIQKEKVLCSLQQFITSADESNVKKLDSVLHKDYRNVQYGFFGETGVYVLDKERYISLIKEKTFGGVPRDMEILSLEVHDHIAMAKLRLKSRLLRFTSFISLIYDDQRWQVIGNFPDVRSK